MQFIGDLFIIDFFAAFERLLRNRLSASIASQEDALSEHLLEVVRKESEYIRIEYFLKHFADPQHVGLIKQIKKYRDWVAHGRRELSRSPAKPIDIYIIFEVIRLVAVVLDTDGFLYKET
ncbi:hypothetical protein [Desulfonema magnum]|uniref:Uncharacterized protein n=1 Tax=Desulfonema magnum TaxID=45655 RepID=A0A975BMS2_9BACT|nr:hypothetical protein [Desulfonema magnum]QTA87879.1 Uncharacterized protein dnm_039190 [Desulfonema magnum]